MINRLLVLVLLVASVSASSFAQNANQLNSFKTSAYDGENVLITTTNGYIEITPFAPDVIRVTYKAMPGEAVKSFSTIAKPGKVKVQYIKNNFVTVLKTSLLKVVVNKKDLSISFVDLKNDTLSQTFNYIKTADSAAINFHSDGREAFYGGGSKAIDLNKRGQVLQNYNQAHWDYKYGQTDLNISIPFLISNRNYGIYMDNAAKSSFDICKTDPNVLGYKVSSGPVSFFFIGGENPDKILFNYTKLTGRQPLPPRWALGYISSRYGYKSEKEVTNVIDKTQAAGIPLDAVVFDLFWYKADTLMGNHNWYRDSFPDPQKMLHNYLNKGIKVVTISETYITQKSENYNTALQKHLLTPDYITKPAPHIFKDFWASPAGLLDIFKPQAQQFYWNFYKARIKEGTAGWWMDLGEPESSSDSLRFAAGPDSKVHNVYALIWAKTAFNGYRKDFPNSRILLLPRSGYAGMQRYSVFPWSGDIDRSFDGLKAQIPIITTMGLNGVAYMHVDAGGFTTGQTKLKGDPELYSRWLEFAAFCPVMRTHADATNYSPEPIFWDDTTRLRVTKYIKLRYQLLPYNYTLAYINTTTGRPLMLPLNYFDDSKQLSNINDEYLWGGHILVAPVIVKGQIIKKAIFPKGEWIGFNDLKTYKDSAEVSAPIDSLPLFVKAGSIITMTAPITNTSQYDGKSLILKYYMGTTNATVKSQWFYDNGTDPKSLEKRQYDLVDFISSGAGNEHSINIKAEHLISRQKKFKLIVPGKRVRRVKFSNRTKYTVVGNEIYFDWNGHPLLIDIKTL